MANSDSYQDGVILRRWHGESLSEVASETKRQLPGGKLAVVAIEVKTSLYDNKHLAHTVEQVIDSRWHLHHVWTETPVLGGLAFGDSGNNVCPELPSGVDLVFRFRHYDELLLARTLEYTLDHNIFEVKESRIVTRALQLSYEGKFPLQDLLFVSGGVKGIEKQHRIIEQHFGGEFLEATCISRGMVMERYVVLELCRAIEQLRVGYRTTVVTGVPYGVLIGHSKRIAKKSEIDILAFASPEVIRALANDRSVSGGFTVEKSPELEALIGL